MRLMLVALLFAYTVNVQHARTWLQERTTPRAFHCAHVLWDNESGWAVHARTGKTYGIPQALPGKKMASAGRGWRNVATVQVRWGRRYVRTRYGTFCRALAFQNVHRWY